MKKFILPILFILTLTQVHPVWADLSSRLAQQTNHLTAVASKAAEKQNIELNNIIASADKMITNRLTSLNALLTRIQNDTRLSDNEKTTLTGQVNSMITNLQALKTKIDADTDVATARADRKTIVTSYHVYVTFEPQMRLLTIVENLQTTTANIQNLIPQLTSLSTTLKGEGKDTKAMDAAIADMNTQLSNISSILSKDQTTLGSVSLTNNTYQSTYTQVRQDMATVRADFAQIRHDFAAIQASMKGIFKVTTTTTPSAASTSAK